MCGIVYAKDFRNEPVNQRILQRYKAQRSRGTQGFGYFMPLENQLYHNPTEKRILRRLEKHASTEILFHHRWPTSTDNIRKGCHPYSTKGTVGFKHQYVLVHNGVISNARTLKADHAIKGIHYRSEYTVERTYAGGTTYSETKFNDSEALLYDVALYLEGKQDALKAQGSNAFVCVEINNRQRPIALWFGHNSGNPLRLIYKPGKKLTISSEGKGDMLLENELYRFDYKTLKLTHSPLTIPTYSYTAPVQRTYTQDDNTRDYWKPEPRQQAIQEAVQTIKQTQAEADYFDELDACANDHIYHSPSGDGFYDRAGIFVSWEEYSTLIDDNYSEADAYADKLLTEHREEPSEALHQAERALKVANDTLLQLYTNEPKIKDKHKSGWQKQTKDIEERVAMLEEAIGLLKVELVELVESEVKLLQGGQHDTASV